MTIPSGSPWPLFALPLGVVVGCVGAPFIEHEDAIQTSHADAGVEADESPSGHEDNPVEPEPIVNVPPNSVSVGMRPSDPLPSPSDTSLPLGTSGMGGADPPSPSPSAAAPPMATAPAVSAPPENGENQGQGGSDPIDDVDDPAAPCVDCVPAGCGNGVLEPDEECDDGNTASGDACNFDCGVPICGDGIVQAPDEECDDGNGIDDDACANRCTLPRCGDGIVSSGETCEDGNTADGDGCSATCRSESCGDGVVSMNEDCDDGAQIDGDGCSANCASEVCGDGNTTPNEQCDDGNLSANDGCGPTCQDERCGDGTVQSQSEQCDDGNEVDSDLCRNGCTNPASLNSLSSSCAFADQITQTVCMVATANWCNQFGHFPIAGLVTGAIGDNEFTVGCIVGFESEDVATSKLDQCPGGRQQSPSCLEQVNAACNELGYDRGFYVGIGSSPNTYALACDEGAPSTASVPGCDGIADTSPVPITCAEALSNRCGDGKGGMIQARAQSNQVTYTCVDLSLTGTARQF